MQWIRYVVMAAIALILVGEMLRMYLLMNALRTIFVIKRTFGAPIA
jgi:hypothetical protein